MFGLGIQELIIILVVALIVIGPRKLPELARSLGKAFGEFRRATDDLKQNFDLSSGVYDQPRPKADLLSENLQNKPPSKHSTEQSHPSSSPKDHTADK